MQKGEVRMAESGKGGTEEASEPEQDQDGLSAHSPFQAPRSSASSLPKELPQVELELRLLQALEIYHPAKLQGMHRHFVLFGMMEYLKKRLNRNFSADEILQLLDRFYNIEMLKPDDEEMEILNQEEEFSLPPDFHDDKWLRWCYFCGVSWSLRPQYDTCQGMLLLQGSIFSLIHFKLICLPYDLISDGQFLFLFFTAIDIYKLIVAMVFCVFSVDSNLYRVHEIAIFQFCVSLHLLVLCLSRILEEL